MTEHQIHLGKKFYLDKQTGYWISTSKNKIRAHVWVWQNSFGKVPEGFHIHHIDENKSNNNLVNLCLVHKSIHPLLHPITPEKRQKCKENLDKIRHLTKEWHSSEEGRLWHKYHALKTGLGKWESRKYSCIVCFKEYESTKRSGNKFCSNACKSKFRRKEGLDNVEAKCEGCGNDFMTSKYKKNRFCSRKCSKRTHTPMICAHSTKPIKIEIT